MGQTSLVLTFEGSRTNRDLEKIKEHWEKNFKPPIKSSQLHSSEIILHIDTSGYGGPGGGPRSWDWSVVANELASQTGGKLYDWEVNFKSSLPI
jgi:hypothetical protein